MKTHNEELEEMIDVVIKLTWNYTVFRTLFAKNSTDSEARENHPEFFLTVHDSLFCAFCVATEILFEEKEKATSLWSLIRKSNLQMANSLSEKIRAHNSSIKKIETVRHQVCCHRLQAKSPQEVFAEVQLRMAVMSEIADLSRSVILELVGDVDHSKRIELERQQLSESRLQILAEDADEVISALQ